MCGFCGHDINDVVIWLVSGGKLLGILSSLEVEHITFSILTVFDLLDCQWTNV